MGKFIFKDRVTKGIIFEVEMTDLEMNEKHNNNLNEIYADYDKQKHTCVYEQL